MQSLTREEFFVRTIEREEDGRPPFILASLLAQAIGSVGSTQYQSLYVCTPDGPCDVTDRGDLSCAYLVSSLLHTFDLIKGGVHSTVKETVEDMYESGWFQGSHPIAGAVVVWGAKFSTTDKKMHRHIGLCINEHEAVSTDPQKRSPQRHGIETLRDHEEKPRLVEAFFYHQTLINECRRYHDFIKTLS